MALFKKNNTEEKNVKKELKKETEVKVQEEAIKIDYWSLKNKISSYVSTGDNNAALADNKANIYLKGIIQKYLYDNKYIVEGMTEEELIERLYNDMAELSILTKYLKNSDNLEEININAWDDIVLTYVDGHKEKIAEKF